MNNISAFANNLTIRKGVQPLPNIGIDDQNKTVILHLFAQEIGIEKTTIIRYIQRNKKWINRKWAYKDNKNRWILRIIAATKFIEAYRHKKCNTRIGKKWTEQEIKQLYCKENHVEVACKLNRTEAAIKTKRSKLGIYK